MAEPSMDEWLADLAALKEAIGAVGRESTEITTGMASIATRMNDIGTSWNSPSYATFDDIKSWFLTCQNDLEALMEDILRRMNTTYANYHDAEGTNYGNVTDGPSDG
ncbi:WXG100 family type VII secretion target [Streptomyces sp. NPDC091292]|uniref:WXG100 family type VII secretion target n=1 Tax=Streptomyces sp. NPDC091292 TaxID=3365991 RepID=UPI003815EF16